MPHLCACPTYEGFNGGGRALDPTKDDTYTFLAAFLSEQADLFEESPYMHFVGDEVRFPCFDTDPALQTWMAAHNISDYQALVVYFWQRFSQDVWPNIAALGK